MSVTVSSVTAIEYLGRGYKPHDFDIIGPCLNRPMHGTHVLEGGWPVRWDMNCQQRMLEAESHELGISLLRSASWHVHGPAFRADLPATRLILLLSSCWAWQWKSTTVTLNVLTGRATYRVTMCGGSLSLPKHCA